MSKEDGRMVEAVLEGQVDAFSLLLDKYYSMIYKYFAVMLSPGDEKVEDLCQDTFLAAFKGLSSLENKEQFKSWIFGIASNKLKTEFRKRKKERDIEASITDEEKIREEELANEIQEERVREMVWKGLARLDKKMKDVITLKYFANLSYEEIGEALDIPKSTVRGRMYRAYQTLRTIFKEEQGGV